MKKLFLVLAFVIMGVIGSYAITITTSCGIVIEYSCTDGLTAAEILEDAMAIDAYLCE